MATKKVDVVIVGAGPTGLTLALELALYNISFRILDKIPAPSDKSRALVVHPRSLELLRRHGVSDKLRNLGTIGTGVRVFVHRSRAAALDFTDLGIKHTEYPQPIWVSQAHTEGVLRNRLKQQGHEVEWNAAVEEIQQDDGGVDIVVAKGESKEQIRCAYVVGCDGAHSVVRHAAGLSFEGAPYPQDFFLCDARLEWDHMAKEGHHITMFSTDNAVLILFPMPDGIVRFIASLTSGTLKNIPPNGNPTIEDFREIFGMVAPGTWKLSDPIWLARFKLHHRGVNEYRSGRLLVAGDAAHIHSPAGGQGMNTGIQDSINLGWKLARAIQNPGEASEALLDTYSTERQRIGQHLLDGTDRIFSYTTSTSRFWTLWRHFVIKWLMPWAFRIKPLRARAFRFASGLGIRYRHSPLVGTSANYRGRLKGGDRAPDGLVGFGDGHPPAFLMRNLSPEKYHLLLFSGRGAQSAGAETLEEQGGRLLAWLQEKQPGTAECFKIYDSDKGDVARAVVDTDAQLHALYGFKAPGYALVRPDAHVAYIGPLDQTEDFRIWIQQFY